MRNFLLKSSLPLPLVLALLLMIAVLSVYFLRGEGVKRGSLMMPGIKTHADLSIQKFHFTEREKGKRKWEIWAERAERFLEKSQVHMDQVEIEFFLEEGGMVRLSGKAGDYFETEKRVELSGEVQVETDSGYTLYADDLIWEEEENLIRTEKPVRLVTEQYVVRGDRMAYRTDTERVELVGGIQTVITQSLGQPEE